MNSENSKDRSSEDSETISEKRLAANRAHALRSTGPTSVEGKRRSSKNAMKHNVFSQPKLLSPGDKKRLQGLRRRLFADLQPVGILEILCVNEFALTKFRQTRIARWENGLICESVDQAQESLEEEYGLDDEDLCIGEKPPKLTRAAIAAVSMADADQVGLITRYEKALDRKAERLLAQLRRL